jgi:hypothetical protein
VVPRWAAINTARVPGMPQKLDAAAGSG